MTTYNYSISTDFPNSRVCPDVLGQEILASAITSAVYDHTDTNGDVCSIIFKSALSEGDEDVLDAVVAAHQGNPVSGSTTVHGASGGQVNTASTTQTAVRATAYNEPSANGQLKLVSANANDAAAGTGARTVRIVYLDDEGNGPYCETVTLNGTTPVSTASSNLCYIERMEVLTAGSGGKNAGVISLKSADEQTTIGSIAAGDNATQWAHHYTPQGWTTYITSAWVNHNGVVAGSGGVFQLKTKELGVDGSVEQPVPGVVRLYGQASTTEKVYGSSLTIVGPRRTTLYITPESSSSLIYRGAFDFYCEQV